MGNGDKRYSSHSQDRRESAQAQGESSNAGRYSGDQVESWHWRNLGNYSDELQQIITLITSGHEPGKAIKEDHHADK